MADTPFSVDSFKSKLAGGGARPSLFEVSWTEDDAQFSLYNIERLLVKAASLPTSNIAPLVQNYGGRAYKLQGFRTFDVWTVTIINDESFSIRAKIKQWMEKLAGKMDGERSTTVVKGAPPIEPDKTIEVAKPYADGTATVTQFNQHGDPTKSYKFHNLWPSELAPIPVDWSSDMVEEFTVTFCYDYWTSGTTNSAIGNQTNDVNTGLPATPTATIADAG